MSVLRRALPVVVPVIVLMVLMSLVLYPLCGALFRCGCVSVWAGAADHCNVHAARGPRCPWCENTVLGGMGFVLMLGGTALAFVVARRRGTALLSATLLAAAALPLAALLSAAVTFVVTDYPHLLVKDARARLGLPDGPVSTRAPESR